MIKRLFRMISGSEQTGKLGIEIGPQGFAIAWVNRSSDQIQMLGEEVLGECVCHYIEGDDLGKNALELKEYLAEENFEGMSAHIILHPSMYQAYFVDRPDVSDEELNEALRWKIKDLIEVRLSDLIIDNFPLPDDAYGGNQRKVYVIATKREKVEGMVKVLEGSGLTIASIGIGELAMVSIVNLLHGDVGSAAMLRMRRDSGVLNLSEGGSLCLTRPIESGTSLIEVLDENVQQKGLDALLLEIQRSLDFYDSQLRKGRIKKFFMAPTDLNHKKIDSYLEDHLGVNVIPIDVNKMFDLPKPISGKLQANCFAAIGAACSDLPKRVFSL